MYLCVKGHVFVW